MLQRPHDFEAEIRFLTEEEGGRRTPVKSGYRPNHDFGIEGELTGAVHVYNGREWVNPGETVTTRLWLIATEHLDYYAGHLHEGFEFTVQEGARIVGRGRVTKILNKDLPRPKNSV